MKIWFDMDGTIADLYGVDNWLEYLINGDAFPYANAKPLVNLQSLARVLNNLSRKGHEINIVSWLSKNSTKEYDEKVTKAKREWLNKHLASVNFTHIDIISYGTPKHIGRDGILFDDELNNRISWGENAYCETEIFTVLRGLK